MMPSHMKTGALLRKVGYRNSSNKLALSHNFECETLTDPISHHSGGKYVVAVRIIQGTARVPYYYYSYEGPTKVARGVKAEMNSSTTYKKGDTVIVFTDAFRVIGRTDSTTPHGTTHGTTTTASHSAAVTNSNINRSIKLLMLRK